jgi:hypothetical protein
MGLSKVFENSIATLPLATYRAGETVMTAGTNSHISMSDDQRDL